MHAGGLDLREHDVDVASRRVRPGTCESESQAACFVGERLDLDHGLCLS